MNTDHALAHGLARLGLGMNIALHGLTRIPNLRAFNIGLQDQFANTFLHPDLVYASGYLIAWGEAILGVLLVLGLFLRPTLVAGTLLMILLTTGSCLIQNWASAGMQLPYIAFYAALLATASKDRFSLDHLIARRKGNL
jgi:thiosulfate dehydrogenase [quinone] large subunit